MFLGDRAETKEWAKRVPEVSREARPFFWLPAAAHHLWTPLAADRRLISLCSLAQNSPVRCLPPSLTLGVVTVTPEQSHLTHRN